MTWKIFKGPILYTRVSVYDVLLVDEIQHLVSSLLQSRGGDMRPKQLLVFSMEP